MAHVKVFCFLASYAVVFGLELTRLLGRSKLSRLLTLTFGLAGFVAHCSYLWHRGLALEMTPLLSSTQDWWLVLAWVAVLLYLFISVYEPNSAVGLFLLPLALAMIGAAYLLSPDANSLVRSGDPRLEAMHNWALLHAGLILFGIAGVVMGVVLSVMYLFQHGRLKQKRTLQQGLTLPSLASLARWNWWVVIVSVPLLTLGLASGVWLAILSRRADVPVTLNDPFILGTGVVWSLMFVFFLWLVRDPHPVGKRVAWLTVWACGFLLATLIGLQVVTSSWLGTWHSLLELPSVSGLV